jgi:hypothetical protein
MPWTTFGHFFRKSSGHPGQQEQEFSSHFFARKNLQDLKAKK